MAQIISNQATASYSVEGSLERRSATSNVANTVLLDAYSLEVSKQSLQQTFTAGENITYAIRVTNNGYKALNNFKIVDTITAPAENEGVLTYMQYTARLSYNGDFISLTPSETNPLTFNVPYELASGQSFTVTYVSTVGSQISQDVLAITNSVTVSGAPVNDPEGVQSYSATNTATINRDTTASLTIMKTASTPTIFDSETYQYILTIENNGLTDANNVVLTDQLPTGFKVSNIRVENENFVHDYTADEYEISQANLLTIPSGSGTAINVKAVAPGINNTTTVTITGTYTTPED